MTALCAQQTAAVDAKRPSTTAHPHALNTVIAVGADPDVPFQIGDRLAAHAEAPAPRPRLCACQFARS
jgi:hypothetical protein